MNEESKGECFFQVVLMINLHIAAFVMSLKRREFGCQGLINIMCSVPKSNESIIPAKASALQITSFSLFLLY